ncbi:SPX, N-terminal [Lasallia pustulata]|uniref:SPX, N-terminal n=1 Tax=Lasallia pustulata TaxID=136370 RepID=A0A1W5CRQ7_9LECA|nr:SPX, N-terminal [Lasallia pustulata]
MKFAKELEQDLVPEWRAKYLDYKTGKKKVKAVARALRNVNQTPKTPGRRRPANLFSAASFQLPIQNRSPFDSAFFRTRPTPEPSPAGCGRGGLRSGKLASRTSRAASSTLDYCDDTPPITIPEHRALPGTDWDSGTVTNYGSIIASPMAQTFPVGPPSLELPDPALSPNEDSFARHNRAWRNSQLATNATPPLRRTASTAGDAYEVGRTHTPSKLGATLLPKHRNALQGRRTFSTPAGPVSPARPTFLRRLFSNAGSESPQSRDVPLEAYKEFDLRQAEFFTYLDKELDKIESFYRAKEGEATERLKVLRQQLHEMRDRRLEEVLAAQRAREHAQREHEQQHAGARQGERSGSHNGFDVFRSSGIRWMKPIEHAIGVGGPHFGKNTKALGPLGSPSGPSAQRVAEDNRRDSRRDFIRRQILHDEIPYRSAKRKLKLALLEYYRGLELLKSYALLNRTAFRKINKKYDKAVHARPAGRYTSEKVNKAWFVQSEVLDGHIVAVEDLYARYFERGNHKVAVGKLRSKSSRAGDYSGSVFRNGLLLAAGMVFGIQGIVYGADHLSNRNPSVSINTSYLLQIYGGYFLGNLLCLLFCLDARIWLRAKINYVFIFEFDTRHNLDWRQLSELPCFFVFLQGLVMWLNFQQPGSDAMFIYWPVLLLGLTVLILFFPGPTLYHKSREWWAYSNFRLLLAGLYPVEFRDFFLGDMYCSQTYAMGNLELFFCLYAGHWDNPSQCNSSHSRVLGFFSTLPGIWRALQCLRRYYDTRNAFPHLVNCGKYIFTILYYMTLSLYRLDKVTNLKALFIACATINAVYCSIWDLAMDWSLCNPYARNPFLRDVLGYKRPWVYYAAMLLDPILRFNWIFYAIYSNDLQHSAALSFFVSLSEVCRRAIWTLFRVENEHCTNVGRFRASRDVPLPYDLPPSRSDSPGVEDDEISPRSEEPLRPRDDAYTRRSSGADLETATAYAEATPGSGTLRRRVTPSGAVAGGQPSTPIQRGIARVGTMMAQAHAQDFERKRSVVYAHDI